MWKLNSVRGLISLHTVSASGTGTSHKAIIQLLGEELWFLFLDLSTRGGNDYAIMEVQKFASWLGSWWGFNVALWQAEEQKAL